MPLTSQISSYDPNWPAHFGAERQRLEPIFQGKLIRIEHVGSTAVPLLSAKPEIDILVEISDSADLDQNTSQLLPLGYRRGRDLSNGHHFFKRDVGSVRTHKLHVITAGHTQVSRLLKFRDHLRSNTAARLEYEGLKLRLEADNKQGISEYLAQKAPHIDQVLNKLDGA